MAFTVSLQHSPVYEFIVSFCTIMEKKTHSTLDMGSDWPKSVKQDLPSDFFVKLGALRRLSPGFPIILALKSPANQPQHFIEWLEGLPSSNIYESLLWLRDGVSLTEPQKIAEWKTLVCPLLRTWYEQYFRKVEDRVMSKISEDISGVQTDVPPHELVQKLSNGIRLDAMPEVEHVYLIPQYHYRPWNLYDIGNTELILTYPCRVEPVSGETPSNLLRVTKSLADENRLKILRMLANKPHTFMEIVGKMRINKSTVHHHMMNLRAAGLVWIHLSSGRNQRFSLRMEAIQTVQEHLNHFLEGGRR